MTKLSYENNNVYTLTNTIAEQIDFRFYKLKSSYKALMIYELFGEIIKCRNYLYKLGDNVNTHEDIKDSTMKQLLDSTLLLNDSYDPVKESFYLGMICNTIVHTNLPLPEEFYNFGVITARLEDIDK